MHPDSPEGGKKIDRLRDAMYSRTLSEQLTARDRRALDPVRPVVGDDFVRPEQALPAAIVAPRGITVARTALRWVLAASVFFFLAALIFFGYYFLFGGGSLGASASNIDITVSGPPQVQGGAITQLQVIVTNRNSVPLQLSDLLVTYPDGTRSASDFQTPLPSTRIDLGTIGPGESRQGEIPAVFAGVAGQRSDVKIELEYRLSGSSAIFVASTDYGITFGSSPLSVGIDGNSQTISGQPTQFTVTVSSNATAPVKDALLSVTYPFGFKFVSASPAPAAPGFWTLGDLNPGDSRTITIQGILSGDPGDSRVFNFVAGTRASSTATTVSTPLASEPYAMNISESFLGLSISVGGASSSITVSPGERVPVSLDYVNNLPSAIQNVVIVANFAGTQIDGSTVRTENGFYRSSDSSMIWNKTTTDGLLGSIPAGGKGTLRFTFLAPSSDQLKSVTNPHIVISVSAAGQRTDQSGVPQSLQSAASQTIGIASDLELAAQGLYRANPFGSTGPLPPKANTETTYAIVFTITNTTDQINGAKLVARLPPYVRWLGSYSPAYEHISFNQDDGTVTWDLGTVASNTGVNGAQPRQAAIAIGFTPSTSQIGEQPALIQNISLTGIDATNSAQISKGVPDVTTNLARISQSSAGVVIGTDPGFQGSSATVVK